MCTYWAIHIKQYFNQTRFYDDVSMGLEQIIHGTNCVCLHSHASGSIRYLQRRMMSAY